MDCLTLGDVTDRLSRNVDIWLPIYAAFADIEGGTQAEGV
jgi:hypothetical protein